MEVFYECNFFVPVVLLERTGQVMGEETRLKPKRLMEKSLKNL